MLSSHKIAKLCHFLHVLNGRAIGPCYFGFFAPCFVSEIYRHFHTGEILCEYGYYITLYCCAVCCRWLAISLLFWHTLQDSGPLGNNWAHCLGCLACCLLFLCLALCLCLGVFLSLSAFLGFFLGALLGFLKVARYVVILCYHVFKLFGVSSFIGVHGNTISTELLFKFFGGCNVTEVFHNLSTFIVYKSVN